MVFVTTLPIKRPETDTSETFLNRASFRRHPSCRVSWTSDRKLREAKLWRWKRRRPAIFGSIRAPFYVVWLRWLRQSRRISRSVPARLSELAWWPLLPTAIDSEWLVGRLAARLACSMCERVVHSPGRPAMRLFTKYLNLSTLLRRSARGGILPWRCYCMPVCLCLSAGGLSVFVGPFFCAFVRRSPQPRRRESAAATTTTTALRHLAWSIWQLPRQ